MYSNNKLADNTREKQERYVDEPYPLESWIHVCVTRWISNKCKPGWCHRKDYLRTESENYAATSIAS